MLSGRDRGSRVLEINVGAEFNHFDRKAGVGKVEVKNVSRPGKAVSVKRKRAKGARKKRDRFSEARDYFERRWWRRGWYHVYEGEKVKA